MAPASPVAGPPAVVAPQPPQTVEEAASRLSEVILAGRQRLIGSDGLQAVAELRVYHQIMLATQGDQASAARLMAMAETLGEDAKGLFAEMQAKQSRQDALDVQIETIRLQAVAALRTTRTVLEANAVLNNVESALQQVA
jgi:hypothetical protein